MVAFDMFLGFAWLLRSFQLIGETLHGAGKYEVLNNYDLVNKEWAIKGINLGFVQTFNRHR